MIDLQFAEPRWIHLIWAVLGLVAILVWLEQRGSRRLDLFLSTRMQQRLVRRPKQSRRLIRIGLLGLAGLLLVLAIMRPQSGLYAMRTPRAGAQVMICLDVSKSMLAADIAPNRLERSKAEILDLLGFLDRDHVGLTAFAGKATVLCPLTPDFGFLRMVLESTGPHSVVRGGTNLESPIRKAVDGFRGQSDLSRVIVLITDGEDLQDSFSLDAAKDAAERGIRIITIGFGDEAGANVFVNDPKTGARTQLLDAAGQPVITRLDGQTLRQIAVETGGAYIPAATGTLDLKAIYEAHIEPLTRGRIDDQVRIVKQPRYQWPLLLAMACLIAAATVGSSRPVLPAGVSAGRTAAAVTTIVLLATASSSQAKSPAEAASRSPQGAPQATASAADQPSDTAPPEEEDKVDNEKTNVDPREVYNEALDLFQDEKLDEAERQFTLARRRAAADGQTRYRSTYNLGWVEIRRANELIKKQPDQAISHLISAAGWFREAVRLAPDESPARENLEIVTRRAMALADALAQQQQTDLAALLDDLIKKQRAQVDALQGTVEAVAAIDQPTIPDSFRDAFRALEVEQRQILAHLDEVAQRAREEADQLNDTAKENRTAEQNVRLAQLENVQAFLYQAGQRVGQARRHLRARQAERAYRRASVALGELKRARDQLRDLVEILGDCIKDAALLSRQTVQLAAGAAQTPESQAPATPNWLSREHLEDSLNYVRDRTDEMVARVAAGLDQKSESDDGPADPDDATEQPQQNQDFAHLLTEADPLLRGARSAFDEAAEALTSQRDHEAYEAEALAAAQLIKARELFLNVRGLIEVMYADQKRMQTALRDDAGEQAPIGEYLPWFSQLQASNIKRGRRLDDMLERQLAAPAADGAPAPGANADLKDGEEDQARKREQLELARQLLWLVMASFDEAQTTMARLSETEENKSGSGELQGRLDKSVEQLEVLRRLFFSIIEHLRSTLRRQVELADETRDVFTLTDEEKIKPAVGPLSQRQQELSNISQQVANSLKSQAEQNPAAPAGATGAAQDPYAAQASQDVAHRMLQAAERVSEARESMDTAVGQMGAELDLKSVQEHQLAAATKLAEALQLLEPPQQQDQQQQQQQQNQDQQQGKQSDDEEKTQPPSPPRHMDMANLLQAVRDREAQRQRDKRQRSSGGYVPVEKDW